MSRDLPAHPNLEHLKKQKASLVLVADELHGGFDRTRERLAERIEERFILRVSEIDPSRYAQKKPAAGTAPNASSTAVASWSGEPNIPTPRPLHVNTSAPAGGARSSRS